jgi:hypothetical protein
MGPASAVEKPTTIACVCMCVCDSMAVYDCMYVRVCQRGYASVYVCVREKDKEKRRDAERKREGERDSGLLTPPLCASEPASAVVEGGAAADAAGVAGAGGGPLLDADAAAAAGVAAFPFASPLPFGASPLPASAPSLPAFSTCIECMIM